MSESVVLVKLKANTQHLLTSLGRQRNDVNQKTTVSLTKIAVSV